MLIHMVLFDFKEFVGETQREEILENARKKLSALPGVQHLLVGKNIKVGAPYGYALSMYFPDVEALEAYRVHPDHAHFRDEEFFPFLEKVEGLDYAD